MCGIAGIVTRLPGPGPDTLDRIVSRLERRGPDAQGRWSVSSGEWNVQLGHRRLTILDAAGGAQPMPDETTASALTYNGELFNFQELRKELEAEGTSFRSRSDTEVVLRWLGRNGAGGLVDFNGMFAVALWDGRKQELLLARDRAGIKPLYYAPLAGGGVVFASELSALLEHPDVSRELDAESLAYYLFCDFVPSPATAVTGVRKLPPGSFVVWRRGKLSEPAPYWRLPTKTRDTLPSLAELEEELLAKLRAAVARELVADVPIGMLLSGGVDSSLVAALVRERHNGPMMSFSLGFEDRRFDERGAAKLVASRLGTTHLEEVFDDGDVAGCTARALAILDEPMADPSLLPMFLLASLAAKHVKVALSGDGGDEVWAGYPTYRAARLAERYRLLPRALRDLIAGAVARLPAQEGYQGFEWKAKRFCGRWDDDRILRHFRWMSATDVDDVARATGRPFRPARLLAGTGTQADPLNALLAIDFRNYMTGSVLTKVDRASMAVSLEVRPPLLDNDIVDFAFSLPGSLKLRGDTTKFLLRRVAARFLPKEIAGRAKKGFAIPLARWLRGPMQPIVHRLLADSPLWERTHGAAPLVHRDVFARWFEEHLDGRVDRSKPLWALTVLDEWMKRERIVTASATMPLAAGALR